MNGLKDNVEQISVASSEQSNGVEEISKAIQDISSITISNNEIVNKTSKVASDINDNISIIEGSVLDLERLIHKVKDAA